MNETYFFLIYIYLLHELLRVKCQPIDISTICLIDEFDFQGRGPREAEQK